MSGILKPEENESVQDERSKLLQSSGEPVFQRTTQKAVMVKKILRGIGAGLCIALVVGSCK